jgi:hypothetical protein
MVAEPTWQEVKDVVHSLRNAAAPGADGITAPALKASDTVISYLHRLICLVWRTRKAPLDWKRALLVALYKGKGDPRACDNLRGISLLAIPGKVYAALLLRRVSQHLDSRLLEAQCGFRPGRGITDATFTLRQLMGKAWEYAAPLHLAFIDLRKAFDSVPRGALWRVLRAYGVPPLLVELLMDLHTGTQAAVRLGAVKGESFAVSSGVRQGCVIAPMLFNVYIDFVVRQALARMPDACGVSVAFGFDGTFSPPVGDRISYRTHIALLMYADDMALTCSNAAELLQFLKVLDDVCAECGLCINAAKTEVMSVDRRGIDPLPAVIELRGGQLKQVTQFKYLGSLVSADCTFQADINARIAKAGAAFHGLRHVWDAPSRVFPVGLKSVVYQTCVRSILLFGSESWALPDTLLDRLSVFHNNCLRRILGVRRSDRHSSNYLYARCAEHPIKDHLSCYRLRQLGHVVRMSHFRLPKLALFRGAPDGATRCRGRPRISWAQKVQEDCAAVGIVPVHLDDRCSNRSAWKVAHLSLLPRRRGR